MQIQPLVWIVELSDPRTTTLREPLVNVTDVTGAKRFVLLFICKFYRLLGFQRQRRTFASPLVIINAFLNSLIRAPKRNHQRLNFIHSQRHNSRMPSLPCQWDPSWWQRRSSRFLSVNILHNERECTSRDIAR